MFTFFLMSLWSKLKQWLVIAGVVIATLAGVYLKGRADGKDAAEDQAQDDLLEDIETQKEIRDEVSGLGRDALANRLRKWTKE